MLEQSEEFQNEFKDYKVFNLYTADMGEIWTANKPIHTPADLAGVSLRAASPMTERTLNAYGATTANMPMPDTYDNIERGVVNGLATGPSAIPTYKLDEVVNYGTIGLNLYASAQIMCMSWDAWNKLSPEDQALFDSISGEVLSIKSAQLYDEVGATARQGIAGVEFYELTPDDKAAFQAKAINNPGEYIAELNGNGYDGQGLYDLMISVRDGLR
jgi:TRAP-type C4-dicarboxylate transport system substrate-binding protein